MLSRRLLLAYAALNAVLYSALLPLWEGFDEPFHFAYVQQFGNLRGLPDARAATLSREVETSLLAAPVSSTVQVNVPHTFTYADFFSWTPEHRTRARRALEEIPPNWRWLDSRAHNYEAHH